MGRGRGWWRIGIRGLRGLGYEHYPAQRARRATREYAGSVLRRRRRCRWSPKPQHPGDARRPGPGGGVTFGEDITVDDSRYPPGLGPGAFCPEIVPPPELPVQAFPTQAARRRDVSRPLPPLQVGLLRGWGHLPVHLSSCLGSGAVPLQGVLRRVRSPAAFISWRVAALQAHRLSLACSSRPARPSARCHRAVPG